MAGIGFELKKLVQSGSINGLARAYGYAALIGSGPWVLSILAVLAIGMIHSDNDMLSAVTSQFQVSITYLMAGSLILTSILQLAFTRYAADRLYEEADDMILSNLFGALLLVMLAAGITGAIILALWFRESVTYTICMLSAFVLLCGIWMVVVFASAIKAYWQILGVFLAGYGITVAASQVLEQMGLDGLMLGFVTGQAVLFFGLLALIARQYPGRDLLDFDFLRRNRIYPSLALVGLLYNAAVWIDKFIFWADPLTGTAVIGPLRASPIYDLPIFLGYLSLIPGMAVFLLRMEIDFSQACVSYYATIMRGGTLEQIFAARKILVTSITGALWAIVKVQTITIMVLLASGADLLSWFGISPIYQPLFNLNVLAAGVQLLLLAVLNVLFYLDRRATVLKLCLMLLATNAFFSWMTLIAGPLFFGTGFGLSVLLTAGVGLVLLMRHLEQLEYETFMLQPAHS